MVKKFFGALIAVFLLNVSICAAAELVIFHTNAEYRLGGIGGGGQES